MIDICVCSFSPSSPIEKKGDVTWSAFPPSAPSPMLSSTLGPSWGNPANQWEKNQGNRDRNLR